MPTYQVFSGLWDWWLSDGTNWRVKDQFGEVLYPFQRRPRLFKPIKRNLYRGRAEDGRLVATIERKDWSSNWELKINSTQDVTIHPPYWPLGSYSFNYAGSDFCYLNDMKLTTADGDLIASFHRSYLWWTKVGNLEVTEMGKEMMPMILASTFAVYCHRFEIEKTQTEGDLKEGKKRDEVLEMKSKFVTPEIQ